MREMKFLSRVQLFEIPWTVVLPGSSIRGIFQARVLEWAATSFSIFLYDIIHISLILGTIEGKKKRG